MSIRMSAAALAGLLASAAPAGAELAPHYVDLLLEADRRGLDAARFAETADMVAALAEGGRADVAAAIAARLPERSADIAAWDAVQADPAGEAVEAVAAPADPEPEDEPQDEPEDGGRWYSAPFRLVGDMAWTGALRAGVQVARGNSELTDLTFALELDREFGEGWAVDSQFEYFLSESEGDTTRDEWLADLRLERALDNGLGWYAGGSYERDRVGLYEQSAFLTGGAMWTVLDGPRSEWTLRAGAGQRYREAADTGATTSDWVAEAGSDFAFQITEGSRFTSETTAYAGGGSRLDQRFAVTSALFGDWALQTGLRIKHEFEDRAGFEPTDVRLDLSLLYTFE